MDVENRIEKLEHTRDSLDELAARVNEAETNLKASEK